MRGSLCGLAVCITVITLGAACGPTPTQSRDCILGPWLDFTTLSCEGHSFCKADPVPAECSVSDCIVQTVTFFEESGTYVKTPLLISVSERRFSRGVEGTQNQWAVENGKLRMGQVEAKFECSDTRLLIGDAPYRARSDRPEDALAEALTEAQRTGAWSDVTF